MDTYNRIAELVGDEVTAICTLGNHEFLNRTVDATHAEYGNLYDHDQYDFHYLDLIGCYQKDEVHFFGNVLLIKKTP